MISGVTIRGFSEELEKLAKTPLKEVKKKLKPGDIIHSRPTRDEGVLRNAFYNVDKTIQKSPFTHTALYVGDNKIIHAGEKPVSGGGYKQGVVSETLSSYAKRFDFKALRIKASLKDRKKAVQYAKDQIGKKFNLKGMVRLILPFQNKGREGKRIAKEKAESFFCSELVANAYSGLNLASKKKLKFIWPGDIYRSPLTKSVTELKK